MANTVSSPNMSLPVPVVGTDPGPTYATDLNSCLALVDQHDHTAGNGVKITPLGMNITSDLSFGSNNATNLRTTRFTSQGSALALVTDVGCLYNVNGDLYYNDGSGNQIRMTLSGAVNTSGSGNITGMGATTATVNYVAGTKTFTFLSNTGVPGGINLGPLYLSPNASNTFNIAVTAPTLAASYTLTLPSAPPASTTFLVSDSSGNVTAPVSVVDNSTLAQSGSTLSIKTGGVTRTQLAALGQQVSSACTSYTNATTTFTDVTNLTVTITTTGRPVMIMFIPDGSTTTVNAGRVGTAAGSGGDTTAHFQILRGATVISMNVIETTATAATVALVPPGTLNFVDVVAAGTYTYKLQGRGSNGTATVGNTKMVAYEL